MVDLPRIVRVVIIGGGAAGTSALYHLALKGWTDTLLLEANELTAGSTWHAAGNCPNFSGDWCLMRMQRYSTQLFKTLGKAVDYPIDYHVTGAVRLAQNKDRMEEFRHVAAMARSQGLDFALLSPNELLQHFSLMEVQGLEGGLWDPDDGDIDPSQLTQAFAKGARRLGSRIERFCRVRELHRLPDGSWKVATNKGDVRAEVVVNAAGYYAPTVGAMVGRDVPCITMSHQYLVTDTVSELTALARPIAMLRDPDDSYYLRQERDGFILGIYEKKPEPAWLDALPEDFSFQLYPDDLDRLEWHVDQACQRVPVLGSVGIKKVINGPVPYSPDGNPLIGPAPGLSNFFELCAFSFGIAQSGGAGKILAEWIVDGEPKWDAWSVDPRRFTGFATRPYVVAKAIETYQQEYAIGFPAEERPAGRPSMTSPICGLLKEKGAMFGARGGWERAVWFPRPTDEATEMLSYHRTNWFGAVREECRAVHEHVGIIDLTGFARFEVGGPKAAAWLSGLIAGRLPKIGRVGLAYFCSSRGTVVTEMTITRFDENRFWLLGPAAGDWHDRDWLCQHLPADGTVQLETTTARYGTLVVAGPRARDVLTNVVDCDMSNEAFRWLTHQKVHIGTAEGVAIRVNYVGELGWELHMPIGTLAAVYQAVMAAGAPYGIRDFGMYAMESLRLEKVYRGWKQDLSSEYTPLACGLDRFTDLDKPKFVGRDALLREMKHGPAERLVPLIVEDGTADAIYGSLVWQGGNEVGFITSGGYGHRIDKSIALGYVRPDLAVEGCELEIEIVGSRRRAIVAREPLFDPTNERLRA